MRVGSGLQITLGGMALALLCSCTAQTTKPQPVTPVVSTAGYLASAERPNAATLLPPPPAESSAGSAHDEAENRRYVAMRGTARWQLATSDAVLTFPAAAQTFSCALGVSITEQQTPRLYVLLRRTLIDAGRSTSEAKAHHQRARPFMVNQQPLCTPESEAALRKDGSYPSGHSAVGWAWALVLAEVAPDRTDAVLARGRAFGESRLVCNVHWPSDVAEGRTMASATVARLHANAEFRADVEAAAREVQSARSQGLLPTRDCAAEERALADGSAVAGSS